MEAVLRAIAAPRRPQILRLVWAREWTAGEVAARFAVSRPDISKHLRVLREAGLVQERRDGTRRFYRARPERLAELRAFLDAFWDTSLAAIKEAAEADARRRNV